MKIIDQSLLDEVASRLANEPHPEGIWLYGSPAGGEPHDDSSLDRLVVVPQSDETPIRRPQRAHRSLRGLGTPKTARFPVRRSLGAGGCSVCGPHFPVPPKRFGEG